MKKKLSSIFAIALIGIVILIGIKFYKNSPGDSNIYRETEIGSLEVNDLDYEYGYCQTTGGDPYIYIQRYGEYIRSVTVDFENAENIDSITVYYGNPAISPNNQKTDWIEKEYGVAEVRLYKNASCIRVDLNPIDGQSGRIKINSIRVNDTHVNKWLVCGLLIMLSMGLAYLIDISSKTLVEWAIKAIILIGVLIVIALNLQAAPGYTWPLVILYALLGGMTAFLLEYDEKKEKIFWGLLFFAALIIMCIEAIHMPYNYGPDEDMHMDICRYIYMHHTLPNGTNPEIINEMFGFSYALFPITGFIISGLFMIVGDSFVSPEMLYILARMANVLFSLITIILLIAIAKKIFEKPFDKLFVLAIVFLPQFLFVSAYINSDAFGLMTVALITWLMIDGSERRWKTKSCVLLGLAIGLCLLSYYNCYGMILVAAGFAIRTFFSEERMKVKEKNQLTSDFVRAISITIIAALVISAWWFIRNGIIYDGDVIGFTTKDKLQELYAWAELKPAVRVTDYNSGLSIFDTLFAKGWIIKSCKSYIMSYGYMSVWLSEWIYVVAAIGINILLLGNLVSKKNKSDLRKTSPIYKAFTVSMFFVCLITIILSLTYSYFSDFQPQGRYLLPMYIGFAFFLIRGLEGICLIIKPKLGNYLLWLVYGGIISLELMALFVGVFIECVNVIV